MSVEGYITTSDVAHQLCVERKTVNTWISHGILPAIRVGNRRWMISESVLESFTPPGQVAKAPRPITDEDRATIQQYRNEGFSLTEIARLLGRNHSVVYRQVQQIEAES